MWSRLKFQMVNIQVLQLLDKQLISCAYWTRNRNNRNKNLCYLYIVEYILEWIFRF